MGTLLHAFAEIGDAKRAKKILEEMKNSGIEPDTSCFDSIICYSSLLHALAKIGDAKRAKKIWEEMKNSGIEPNPSCFDSIIIVFAKAGAVEEADKYMLEMEKAGFDSK